MSDPAPRPLALITGASSGIGYELARQFADNGFDLVVAAEDDAIHTAAHELLALGAEVEAVQVDLAEDGGVDTLYGGLQRPLDAIVLNAGIGAVRDMVARDEGRVLFTSSIAATQPGAFHAVYNASKSFVQSFALALREELEDTNVTVTALMPGPTETEFFERADMLDTPIGASDSKDDPADVAREGFEALMKGDAKVVAGSLTTKLQGKTGRFVPDTVKAKLHRGLAEPKD